MSFDRRDRELSTGIPFKDILKDLFGETFSKCKLVLRSVHCTCIAT